MTSRSVGITAKTWRGRELSGAIEKCKLLSKRPLNDHENKQTDRKGGHYLYRENSVHDEGFVLSINRAS